MRRVLALPLSTVERAGHGRPRLAHDRRRRRARAHDPLRRARDADRGGDDGAHGRRPPSGSARSPRSRASPACRRSGSARAGTCGARRRATSGSAPPTRRSPGTVGETVEGGRTVEALGLARGARAPDRRRPRGGLPAPSGATLYLRTVWFPTAEFAYVLPVAAALAWGGWLVSAGHASIGEVTAIALYVVAARRPRRPPDLLARRDPGRRDLVRPPRRHRRASRPTARRPTTGPRATGCARTTSATPTSPAATSCTGSTSTSRPASASPSSGRRARASRRSDGCSPGSTRRASGASRSAACGSSTCRSTRSAGRSRS